VGGLLAALSLLGVAPLLGRRSWAAWVGVMLLLVWLAASLSFAPYSSLRPPEPNLTGARSCSGNWDTTNRPAREGSQTSENTAHTNLGENMSLYGEYRPSFRALQA
jgi:hypothetical protein